MGSCDEDATFFREVIPISGTLQKRGEPALTLTDYRHIIFGL